MKILYVANVDWFFLSHRLPLAKEAIKRNWEVYLLAGDTKVGHEVEQYGIKYIPWNLSRAGMNPVDEIKSILFLYQKYKDIKPDIIHHIAIKPVIYGTFLAKILGVKKIVNALSGLGYTFTDNRASGKILKLLLKVLLRNTKNSLILQNQDDSSLFVSNKIIQENKITLIKGSGVDSSNFYKVQEPEIGPIVVMLPSRILADKGVREFVHVAERLKSNQSVKFVLVGGIDEENPAWISEEEILTWVNTGIIEWWGFQKDMMKILPLANIIVLPSYREGLPKVLIEASMIERAIITTNVPGCREIIQDGINGLIVPSRNVDELESAIVKLIKNRALRLKLARKAHEIAVKEYSINKVINDTFKLYCN